MDNFCLEVPLTNISFFFAVLIRNTSYRLFASIDSIANPEGVIRLF